MTFHFRVGAYAQACDLVEKYHYSGRVPSNVQIVGTWHEAGGLFGDYGTAVAACFLSVPPTRWSEDVIELTRLVRADSVSQNISGLVGSTARHAKKSGFDLLVSFADSTQGHHGGIYQACSWNYHGKRSRAIDGIIWNGAFVPGRAANSRWGTRSPEKLRKLLGPNHKIEPHFDEGKHLYWKALNRSGKRKAERLNLTCCAYPKPDQGREVAA